MRGSVAAARFGAGVAVVDDLDGDGLGELLIGSPGASPSDARKGAGKAYLAPFHGDDGDIAASELESGAIANAKVFEGESGAWDTTSGFCALLPTGCQSDGSYPIGKPSRGPFGDGLGLRVLAPGDVDGDGVPDLVLAAPYAKGSAGYRAGRTYVLSGKTAQAGQLGTYTNGLADGFVVEGEVGLLGGDIQRGVTSRYGDLAGYGLAGGDFDGDGLADVAIGAPGYGGGWSKATYGSQSYISEGGDLGRTYVYFGAADRHGVRWLDDVTLGEGTDRATVIAGKPGASYLSPAWGSSLGAAPDVDGDGRDDLYIANIGFAMPWLLTSDALENEVSLATPPATGATEIVAAGQLGNILAANSGPIDWVTSGKTFLHTTSTGVGDVDGDGRGDLAIAFFEPGKLVLSVFTDREKLTSDLDGPKNGVGGFAISGVPGDGWIADGAQTFRLGDTNGDGLDDIGLVIEPEKAGVAQTSRLYIVYGQRTGAARTLAQIEAGSGGFVLELGGKLALEAAGVTSGDLDGDGLSDIVWGLPEGDSGQGRVEVVFGRDSGAITHYGTAVDDTLLGSSADDVLVGGAGNDVIVGQGGRDTINGGAGDDVIEVLDASFGRVRGGRGTDTLRLATGDLDLRTKRGLVDDIEIIDLSSGAHTLTVTGLDVRRLSTTSNRVIVLGGSDDRLVGLGNDWRAGGTTSYGGKTMRRLLSGQGELLVDLAVVTALPPTFTTTTLSVAENAAAGTSVGRIDAEDPDGFIKSLSFTGRAADIFAFDATSGELTVKDASALDHEATASFRLTLTATDSSGLTADGVVVVNVTDLPEPPRFLSNAIFATLPEGEDDGTLVTTLAASDQDAGDTLTFTITSGNDDGAFAIASPSGALTVLDGTKLDYEDGASRTLHVRVSDGTGRSDDATVDVSIQDLVSFHKTATQTASRARVALFSNTPNYDFYTNGDTNEVSLKKSGTVPFDLGNLLQSDVKYAMDGKLLWSGALDVDQGEFDVSLPMSVSLDFPDKITAGVPFDITTSAALLDGATVAGFAPKATFDVGIGLKDFSLDIDASFTSKIFSSGSAGSNKSHTGPVTTGLQKGQLSYGGGTFTGKRLGDAYPSGVSVGPNGSSDRDLQGAAFAVFGNDANSTVTFENPNVFYSRRVITEVYNGAYDWSTWLESRLPLWGSTNRGAMNIPIGTGTASISWVLLPDLLATDRFGLFGGEKAAMAPGNLTAPSSLLVWAGVQGSYVLEWKGAHVVITLEDGQEIAYDVAYDKGSTTTVTLPASADVNGDGRVGIRATITPRVTFYNWTQPYFRLDSYYYFLALQAKLTETQINQFSGEAYQRTLARTGVGPALSFGWSVQDNFDDYLAESIPITLPYESYATLPITIKDKPASSRTSFDVTGFPGMKLKGAVQIKP